MKNRSVSFLTNLVYGKFSRGEEIPNDLWEELFRSCKTFGHFSNAHFFSKNVDKKWEHLFLHRMKETVNLQNDAQLRVLVRALEAGSADWDLHVSNLFCATHRKGSGYSWDRLVDLFPKETPLHFRARELRSEFKNLKK